MLSNIDIRPFKSSDLDDVMAIEQQVQISPWTQSMFLDCLKEHYISLVVLLNQKIIGYVIATMTGDEAEILNISLSKEQQEKGIGRYLLSHLLGILQQRNIEKVFLEVRVSNHVARKLYERLGFRSINVRQGYYQGEDAVVYTIRFSHQLHFNLSRTLENIAIAAKTYQRPVGEVKLLAVSKGRPADEIRQAISAGQHWFGESYVQEAVAKITAINDSSVVWHFIGPIQLNKTKLIAQYFSWVHGVDRLTVAQRLSDQRPADLEPLNICIQVNISNEPTKSGVKPDELPILARAIKELPHLKLRGLMAIPAVVKGFSQQRAVFAQLRDLFEDLKSQGLDLDTLSMGMTDDYIAAIAEGATIVRIGTGLFDATG